MQWTLTNPDFEYPAGRIIRIGNDCSIRVFDEVCILLEYLNGIRYIHVWASTFQLSEHAQSPMSSDKRGSTVICTINTPLWYFPNAILRNTLLHVKTLSNFSRLLANRSSNRSQNRKLCYLCRQVLCT